MHQQFGQFPTNVADLVMGQGEALRQNVEADEVAAEVQTELLANLEVHESVLVRVALEEVFIDIFEALDLLLRVEVDLEVGSEVKTSL